MACRHPNRTKKPRLSFFWGVLFLILSSALISCTRAQDPSTSLKISLPQKMSSQKVGALAADMLAHVVVNITGEGIAAPINFQWDMRRDSGGASMTAPPIEVVVPQGANRLIQVVAVYMDMTAGSMQFFYGDKIQSLSQANEVVSLAVSSIGAAGSIYTGQIAGRFLTTATSGPTGIIKADYVPPGKPPINIDSSVVYSGWFSIFGLSGAKLSYHFLTPGGIDTPLFGGVPVDLSEASFPASAKLARMSIPTHQEQDNGVWRLQSPEIFVFGFWGANANWRSCVKSTPVTTRFAVGNSATPASNYLAADTSGTTPADFSTNIALPSMYLAAESATANSMGACATTSHLVDGFVITPQAADNGKEAAAGFIGPFKAVSGKAVMITPNDASTYKIAGELMPGVIDEVSGFDIYKNMGPFDYDWIECEPSKLAGRGFQKIASSSANAAAWTQIVPLTQGEVAAMTNIAICPISRKLSMPFPLGVFVKNNYFSGNGGGGGGFSPATQLTIRDYNPTPAYFYCSQFMVEAQTANGQMGSITGPLNINLTGTNATIYTDANCTIAATTANSVMYGSRAYFYMKATAANTSTSVAASYSSGNGGVTLAAGGSSLQTSGPSTTTANSLALQLDNLYSHSPFECIPFFLSVRDVTGAEVTMMSINTTVVTPSISGVPASIYTDSGCTDQVTTLPKSGWAPYSSATLAPFWMRFSASGLASISASQTTGASCTGATACSTPSSTSYTIASASGGVASTVAVNLGGLFPNASTALTIGTCYGISVELYDSNHWPALQTAAASGTISASGIAMCSSALSYYPSLTSCTAATGASPAFSIPAGENRAVIWVKQASTITGSCTFNVTVTAGAGNIVGTGTPTSNFP